MHAACRGQKRNETKTVAAATMNRIEENCTHPVSGSVSVPWLAIVVGAAAWVGALVGGALGGAWVAVGTVNAPPVSFGGIKVGVMVRYARSGAVGEGMLVGTSGSVGTGAVVGAMVGLIGV